MAPTSYLNSASTGRQVGAKQLTELRGAKQPPITCRVTCVCFFRAAGAVVDTSMNESDYNRPPKDLFIFLRLNRQVTTNVTRQLLRGSVFDPNVTRDKPKEWSGGPTSR
ncbi:hypothetical protein BHM03_00007603 [Ensete ventricosum]|nr:hypothetical protein BHM03_00007603 [Ensete ventricosum]